MLALADLTYEQLSEQTALIPKHPWPRNTSTAKVFGRCASIAHDSPTVITVGTVLPTCAPGIAPCEADLWKDLSSCAYGAAPSASAEEHVQAGRRGLR